MDSYEIQEWIEYNKIEPLEYRDDLRASMICAVIANAHRVKGQKIFKAEDFMPVKAKKEEQTWQQQKAVVEMLNAAFSGKDLRKK